MQYEPPLWITGKTESSDFLGGVSSDTDANELTLGRIDSKEEADVNGIDHVEDPRLEQAFALIREVIAEADKRASADLLARLTGATSFHNPLGGIVSTAPPDKRAPRGSAATLIDRALAEAGTNGLTAIGIHAKASSEFEKMVSLSAIRNWLKENERKRPPRYRQVGGVWFLADHAPTVKAVS